MADNWRSHCGYQDGYTATGHQYGSQMTGGQSGSSNAGGGSRTNVGPATGHQSGSQMTGGQSGSSNAGGGSRTNVGPATGHQSGSQMTGGQSRSSNTGGGSRTNVGPATGHQYGSQMPGGQSRSSSADRVSRSNVGPATGHQYGSQMSGGQGSSNTAVGPRSNVGPVTGHQSGSQMPGGQSRSSSTDRGSRSNVGPATGHQYGSQMSGGQGSSNTAGWPRSNVGPVTGHQSGSQMPGGQSRSSSTDRGSRSNLGPATGHQHGSQIPGGQSRSSSTDRGSRSNLGPATGHQYGSQMSGGQGSSNTAVKPRSNVGPVTGHQSGSQMPGGQSGSSNTAGGPRSNAGPSTGHQSGSQMSGGQSGSSNTAVGPRSNAGPSTGHQSGSQMSGGQSGSSNTAGGPRSNVGPSTGHQSGSQMPGGQSGSSNTAGGPRSNVGPSTGHQSGSQMPGGQSGSSNTAGGPRSNAGPSTGHQSGSQMSGGQSSGSSNTAGESRSNAGLATGHQHGSQMHGGQSSGSSNTAGESRSNAGLATGHQHGSQMHGGQSSGSSNTAGESRSNAGLATGHQHGSQMPGGQSRSSSTDRGSRSNVRPVIGHQYGSQMPGGQSGSSNTAGRSKSNVGPAPRPPSLMSIQTKKGKFSQSEKEFMNYSFKSSAIDFAANAEAKMQELVQAAPWLDKNLHVPPETFGMGDSKAVENVMIYIDNIVEKDLTPERIPNLLDGIIGILDVYIGRHGSPMVNQTCLFVNMLNKSVAWDMISQLHQKNYKGQRLVARQVKPEDYLWMEMESLGWSSFEDPAIMEQDETVHEVPGETEEQRQMRVQQRLFKKLDVDREEKLRAIHQEEQAIRAEEERRKELAAQLLKQELEATIKSEARAAVAPSVPKTEVVGPKPPVAGSSNMRQLDTVMRQSDTVNKALEGVELECQLEAMIKDNDEAMVGLSHVTEVQSLTNAEPPNYRCIMCDVQCAQKYIVPHITGLQHRSKYMARNDKVEYAKLTQIQNRNERRILAEHHAKMIEVDLGREKINTKLETDTDALSEIGYKWKKKSEEKEVDYKSKKRRRREKGGGYITSTGQATPANQDIGKQQGANQGFAQLQAANQGFAQPPAANQGFSKPQAANQGFVKPQAANQGFAKPQAANQGFAKPQAVDQGFAKPQAANQGFARPQAGNQGQGMPNQGHYIQNSGKQPFGNKEKKGAVGAKPSNDNIDDNLVIPSWSSVRSKAEAPAGSLLSRMQAIADTGGNRPSLVSQGNNKLSLASQGVGKQQTANQTITTSPLANQGANRGPAQMSLAGGVANQSPGIQQPISTGVNTVTTNQVVVQRSISPVLIQRSVSPVGLVSKPGIIVQPTFVPGRGVVPIARPGMLVQPVAYPPVQVRQVAYQETIQVQSSMSRVQSWQPLVHAGQGSTNRTSSTSRESKSIEIVTPGVQRRIEVKAKLYEMFDGLDDVPLVGLNYITEFQSENSEEPPNYKCKLCDKNIALYHMVLHIRGYQHKSLFLKANYPELFNKVGKSTREVEAQVKEVENMFGRESITVVNKASPSGIVVPASGVTVNEHQPQQIPPAPARKEKPPEIRKAKFDDLLTKSKKKQPLLGLGSITEIQDPRDKEAPKYRCSLCSANYLTCKNVVNHVASWEHRLKFFEKYQKKVYKAIVSRRLNKDMLYANNRAAIAYENSHGRERIRITIDYKNAASSGGENQQSQLNVGGIQSDQEASQERTLQQDLVPTASLPPQLNDTPLSFASKKVVLPPQLSDTPLSFASKKVEPPEVNDTEAEVDVKPTSATLPPQLLDVKAEEQPKESEKGDITVKEILEEEVKKDYDWEKETEIVAARIKDKSIVAMFRRSKFETVHGMRNEKVLGTMWLTEFQQTRHDVDPWYTCGLCQEKITWHDILHHCMSNKHRLLHMEMRYKDMYEMISKKSFKDLDELQEDLAYFTLVIFKKELLLNNKPRVMVEVNNTVAMTIRDMNSVTVDPPDDGNAKLSRNNSYTFRRQKAIVFVKVMPEYANYVKVVPRDERIPGMHPMTPDPFEKCTSKVWQMRLQDWRISLIPFGTTGDGKDKGENKDKDTTVQSTQSAPTPVSKPSEQGAGATKRPPEFASLKRTGGAFTRPPPTVPSKLQQPVIQKHPWSQDKNSPAASKYQPNVSSMSVDNLDTEDMEVEDTGPPKIVFDYQPKIPPKTSGDNLMSEDMEMEDTEPAELVVDYQHTKNNREHSSMQYQHKTPTIIDYQHQKTVSDPPSIVTSQPNTGPSGPSTVKANPTSMEQPDSLTDADVNALMEKLATIDKVKKLITIKKGLTELRQKTAAPSTHVNRASSIEALDPRGQGRDGAMDLESISSGSGSVGSGGLEDISSSESDSGGESRRTSRSVGRRGRQRDERSLHSDRSGSRSHRMESSRRSDRSGSRSRRRDRPVRSDRSSSRTRMTERSRRSGRSISPRRRGDRSVHSDRSGSRSRGARHQRSRSSDGSGSRRERGKHSAERAITPEIKQKAMVDLARNIFEMERERFRKNTNTDPQVQSVDPPYRDNFPSQGTGTSNREGFSEHLGAYPEDDRFRSGEFDSRPDLRQRLDDRQRPHRPQSREGSPVEHDVQFHPQTGGQQWSRPNFAPTGHNFPPRPSFAPRHNIRQTHPNFQQVRHNVPPQRPNFNPYTPRWMTFAPRQNIQPIRPNVNPVRPNVQPTRQSFAPRQNMRPTRPNIQSVRPNVATTTPSRQPTSPNIRQSTPNNVTPTLISEPLRPNVSSSTTDITPSTNVVTPTSTNTKIVDVQLKSSVKVLEAKKVSDAKSHVAKDLNKPGVTKTSVTKSEVSKDAVTIYNIVTGDYVIIPGVTKDTATKSDVGKNIDNKPGVTKDTVTKSGISKDTATKSSVTKDTATKSSVTKDTATKSGVTKDTATKSGITKDTITKSGVTKDTITESGITKDTITKSGVTKDTITKSGITKDTITKSGITEDTITKSGVTKDTVTKSGITKDTITKSGVTKEMDTKSDVTKDNVTTSLTTNTKATKSEVSKVTATNVDVKKDTDSVPKILKYSVRKTNVVGATPQAGKSSVVASPTTGSPKGLKQQPQTKADIGAVMPANKFKKQLKRPLPNQSQMVIADVSPAKKVATGTEVKVASDDSTSKVVSAKSMEVSVELMTASDKVLTRNMRQNPDRPPTCRRVVSETKPEPPGRKPNIYVSIKKDGSYQVKKQISTTPNIAPATDQSSTASSDTPSPGKQANTASGSGTDNQSSSTSTDEQTNYGPMEVSIEFRDVTKPTQDIPPCLNTRQKRKLRLRNNRL